MARGQPKRDTVGKHIFWTYATLGCVEAAVAKGTRVNYGIRSSQFKEYISGDRKMRSFFDDVSETLIRAGYCCYCGKQIKRPHIDHLIPRVRNGPDHANNLVPACRSCNSSKGGKDLLVWTRDRRAQGDEIFFPSLRILRRYIKLIARYCDRHQYIDIAYPLAEDLDLPFALDQLPTSASKHYPPLDKVRLRAESR